VSLLVAKVSYHSLRGIQLISAGWSECIVSAYIEKGESYFCPRPGASSSFNYVGRRVLCSYMGEKVLFGSRGNVMTVR
jgi:hypothetical protein